MLKIPADAKCSVPGCRAEPSHVLSLRMRRRDTGADWAPNTEAYYCSIHANGGADITILYRPTSSREVNVDVATFKTQASRRTKIR